jgi:predicted transcriptional regulator
MKPSQSQKSRKKLGELFRKMREEARLTQSEVAAKAQLDWSYYAEIERGVVNPSLDKIVSIMEVLNIQSLIDLL